MQSRMDKYNTRTNSRTQKNKALYEELKNGVLNNFDVNSNVSIISYSTDSIDVAKLKMMLDKKYRDDSQRRKAIEMPDYPEPVVEEYLVDTKEYDINAILEKAKKGKNVDYNKERLKKIREAQYEILNNLDLELKKVEEGKRNVAIREEESEDLASLVNTITQLEKINKSAVANGETDDLFASLMETKKIDPVKEPLNDLDELEPITKQEEVVKVLEPVEEDTDTDEIDFSEELEVKPITVEMEAVDREKALKDIEKTIEMPGSPRLEPFEIRASSEEDEEERTEDLKDELENTEELAESHLEETLTKLNTKNSFDDFKDVTSGDGVGIALKIFAFIIVIGLVIGAVYILDNILELGLF